MEITTNIYRTSDIPEEITLFLQDNYDDLADILNLYIYDEIPEIDSYFEGLYDDPVDDNLTQKIIEDVRLYSNEVFELNLSDLETRYIPSEDNLWDLFVINSLIAEQIIYTFGEEKDCEIWFITAELNRQLYGGICVFWNYTRNY